MPKWQENLYPGQDIAPDPWLAWLIDSVCLVAQEQVRTRPCTDSQTSLQASALVVGRLRVNNRATELIVGPLLAYSPVGDLY